MSLVYHFYWNTSVYYYKYSSEFRRQNAGHRTDNDMLQIVEYYYNYDHYLSLWLTGTVRAQPETVISRAWVQSPDPAK